jgi:phospholipid transport system substrate-binding protein
MVIIKLAERETFEFLSVAFSFLQASNNAAWIRARKSLKMLFVAHSQFGLMSKHLISKTLILAVCLCLWGSQAIAAENPQAVVQTGTDQILEILNQYSQDTQARRGQIRAVIDSFFDFEAIARLALGPQWRSLSSEKQQEFTQEFSRLLFNTYIGNIEKFAKQKLTYNHRTVGQGYVVVEALVRDQGGPYSLDYYLHLNNGNWTVYDVAVDGMSLVANYRKQFDSILVNGSFDNLSMMLKQKIAEICGSNRC